MKIFRLVMRKIYSLVKKKKKENRDDLENFDTQKRKLTLHILPCLKPYKSFTKQFFSLDA